MYIIIKNYFMKRQRWVGMTGLNKTMAKIDEVLLYIIIEGFLIYGILMQFLEDPGWLYLYPYLALMVLAGIKICIQGNTWKEWIFIILLGCVAFLSYRESGDRAVLVFSLSVCCVKNMNLDKLLRMDICIRIAAAILFIILPFVGIIPNHIGVMVGGRARTFFGWFHPNGMGLHLFLISLVWTYIRHRRFKWYDYAGIAGMVIFLDVTANSRTSEISMLGMLLMEAISVILEKHGKKVYVVWTWVTSSVLLISVALPVLVVGLRGKLDAFFSETLGTVGSRFILTWDFVENHGITLFGSPYDASREEYLDMLFANALFLRGIVFGIILIVLSVIGIYYGFYKKNERYLLLLAIFLMYGIMETEHFNIIYTFFPVLLGIPVLDRNTAKVDNG